MHPGEDRSFFASIQDHVVGHGGTALPEVWSSPDPDAMMARLGRYRMLLTVRLHGMILAGLMGVPSVPIAYDRKVAEAADVMDLGDLVVSIGDVTVDTLRAALGRLEADVERPARLRAAVEEIRSGRTTVTARILMAISG